MRMKLRRHACWAVLLMVAACGFLANAQDVNMQVTRSFSTAHAVPGSTFQVTLHIKANADLQGVGLRENLPLRWTIHPVENAGAAFKRSEAEWVFSETIEAGANLHVIYEVTVPAAGELLSDPLPQCFSIDGTYQATVPSFETPIEGESDIEIVSHLPLETAIAHLIPASDGSPDIIDLRLSRMIQQDQLERALEFWQRDLTVPGTGGEFIDLAAINHLAAQYETCTPADEALPLSIDPELQAVRVLDTNLPCDSVLLPEGCLDPGASARRVTVTVQITPAFDAYGVGLREWFPPAWRVTPIQHEGFWYRPSASEWAYPTRVQAGQTIELTYEVEVIGTAIDLLEADAGCCGQEMSIDGEALSALECSVAPVSGEGVVTVQHCLPVLLAISRWDTENDHFDAELSNLVTLAQVQRAVAFWQDSSPVPHTCGYTVGYHTLKTIVAYWLAGLPITSALPSAGLSDTCEQTPAECIENTCSDGWLCALTEAQDPEDFVGLPSPPEVGVDGGPDRLLTCSTPSVTLTATTHGGVEPFRFEWLGPAGQSLGDAPSLVVTTPGEYTVIAISCGGCIATDTVTVAGDFAAPQLEPHVSGVLTGDVTSVDLGVAISGGTGPFAIQWIGPTGSVVGAASSVSVSTPGTYQVSVTGANGCSSIASIAVEQRIPPIVIQVEILPSSSPISLSVDGGDAVLTCETRNIQLCSTVSGGRKPYRFLWTDPEGTAVGDDATLNVTTPDTYLLTVTGDAGSNASASVTVLEDASPPVLSTSVSGTLTCAVTDVVVSVEASAGRPPYTYVWSDSVGEVCGDTAQITVQEPDAYMVTVTGANGCSTQAEAVVQQDIEPPVVTATSSNVLTCNMPETLLTTTVSGGRAPFTYVWTDATGNIVGQMAELRVRTPGEYAVTVTGANGCRTQASVVVEQDVEAPVVTVSTSDILTCNVPEVTLATTVSGGRAPFTYAWTNAAGNAVGCTADIDVAAPGVYTVTVTGANGCHTEASVTVEQDVETPLVEATVDGVLSCAVPQVDLHANIIGGRSPLEIEWRDAAGDVVGTTALLPVTSAGFYTVSVTGANGCTDTAGVTVLEDREPPVVSAAALDHLSCAVSSVELTTFVTGGSSPYTYAWVDSAGTSVGDGPQLNVNTPGTYTVTVMGANGCEASDTVTVSEDVEPPTICASASGTLSCVETSVTLTAKATDGRAPYTYAWSDADGKTIGTSDAVEVVAPGTYSLTVTGANGCSRVTSVIVSQDIEPPVVSLIASGTLTCASTDVTLTASVSGGRAPFEYSWIDASGNVMGTRDELVVHSPGMYTLTVTGTNGCSAAATAAVSQDIELPIVRVAACGTLTCDITEVCVTSAVSNVQSPSYQWTDAMGAVIASVPSTTVSSSGEYTLTVTGANGCSSCATVLVSQDIEPPVVSAIASGTLSCMEPSITLTSQVTGGRAPYAYAWSDPDGHTIGTSDSVDVDAPGTYVLTVTGANGCSNCARIAVSQDIEPPVVSAIVSGTLTCAGTSVTLTSDVAGGRAPYAYAWSDPDGHTIGTSDSVDVDAPGMYVLTVTGANGCSNCARVAVSQDIEPPVVSLGEDRILTCAEPEVLVESTVCCGRAPFTYLWADHCGTLLATTKDLLVVVPGTYTLTVTGANGCTSSGSIDVLDGIDPPVVDAGPDQTLLCVGDEVLLNATVSGGLRPYQYTWVDACGDVVGSCEDLVVSMPGTYILTVTTSDGCVGMDSVTVESDQ